MRGTTSGARRTVQLDISTKIGKCCLCQIRTAHVEAEDLSSSYPLNSLLRYLKVDPLQLIKGSPSVVGPLSKYYFEVKTPLCSECSEEAILFQGLFEELQKIRLKMNIVMKSIADRIEEGLEKVPSEQLKVEGEGKRRISMFELFCATAVEAFRNDVFSKCRRKSNFGEGSDEQDCGFGPDSKTSDHQADDDGGATEIGPDLSDGKMMQQSVIKQNADNCTKTEPFLAFDQSLLAASDNSDEHHSYINGLDTEHKEGPADNKMECWEGETTLAKQEESSCHPLFDEEDAKPMLDNIDLRIEDAYSLVKKPDAVVVELQVSSSGPRSSSASACVQLESGGTRIGKQVQSQRQFLGIQRKNNPASFKCDKCHKFFANHKSLRKHLSRVHARKGLHKCQLCDKVYNYQDNLVRHQRLVHSPMESLKVYTCEYNLCKYTSYRRDRLKKHMKTCKFNL